MDALRSEGEEFGSFDILTDEAVRQGIKKLSDWPTFPQLYVRCLQQNWSHTAMLLALHCSILPVDSLDQCMDCHAD